MLGMSDETLALVGRVTVAASHLELGLCTFADGVERIDVLKAMSTPGEPLKVAQAAIAKLAGDQRADFGKWVDDAAQLLHGRHTIVHAVWVDYAEYGAVPEYVALHLKSGTETRADGPALADLAQRLETVGARGYHLHAKHCVLSEWDISEASDDGAGPPAPEGPS